MECGVRSVDERTKSMELELTPNHSARSEDCRCEEESASVIV